MSLNKLIIFTAAFMLASFIGSRPAAALVIPPDPLCDTTQPTYDPNMCDTDNNGIADACDVNAVDYLTFDCDMDGVLNAEDKCESTDTSTTDLVVGACTIPDLNILFTEGEDAGCTVADLLEECEIVATNHGRYVSCVAHLTNRLKRQKDITGKEKGQIQRCAARSDIGKKSHP